MPTSLPSGIVTLAFTDIEGSSDYFKDQRDAFAPVLEAHNRLVREVLARRGGVEIKTIGDAFFVAFVRASDAVLWALEVQQALQGYAWPQGMRPIRVRIGLHTGEQLVVHHPDGTPDYWGHEVNKTARVESAAHGGQTLISEATYRLVAAQPFAEDVISFRDLGVFRLKGVGEERLYQAVHPSLPQDFPPPSAPSASRQTLPVCETPFTGREQEVKEWTALLQNAETRLLVLHGPAGMGKTRAALHLAETFTFDHPETFPDGIWWVELADVETQAQMVDRVVSVLGLYLAAEQTAREQLFNFLASRRLLLILDNVEQIPDVAEMLHALAQAAPRLCCLVTTRIAFALQRQRRVVMSPLSVEEAVSLFVERARSVQTDFALTPENTGSIREICRRLEGLPLALVLVASRIVSMAPEDMLPRLMQLLKSADPSLPARHRVLRAALDWSYERLDDRAKKLFVQLSVFAGGFTLEDAEAVCTTDEDEDDDWMVQDGIEMLHLNALLSAHTNVQTQHKRFTTLSVLSDFAFKKRKDFPGETADAQRRHAACFAKRVERLLPAMRTTEEAQAIAALEENTNNLRAAAEWARQSSESSLFVPLVQGLAFVLRYGGFYSEAVEWFDRALEQAVQGQSCLASERLRLLLDRSGLALDLNRTAEAKDYARAAQEAARLAANPLAEAEAGNLLGLAEKREPNYREARDVLEEALRQYRALRDPNGEAQVLNNLGLIEYEWEEGDWERAAHLEHAALRLFRACGDRRGIAEAANNLGVLDQGLGDATSASRRYREALEQEIALGNRPGIARSLVNLGESTELQGHVNRSLPLFLAAERLFTECGHPYRTYAAEQAERAAEHTGILDQIASLRQSVRNMPEEQIVAWALGEAGAAGSETPK